MKTLKYTIFAALIVLNIAILNLLMTTSRNNQAVQTTLSNIPDDVVYINAATTGYPTSDGFIMQSSDYPDAKTNYEKLNQIKALDSVQSVDLVEIPDSSIISVESEIVGNTRRDILLMNQQNLNPQQLAELELSSGTTPTKRNQLVISSAVVEHYGYQPSQIIGSSFNNYMIVGVYNDPADYSQYTTNFTPVITNYAYGLETDDANDPVALFTTSDGTEYPVMYLKITFNNNDTLSNITQLEDKLTINDSISNLDVANSRSFITTNQVIYKLLISVILIDLITLLILFKL